MSIPEKYFHFFLLLLRNSVFENETFRAPKLLPSIENFFFRREIPGFLWSFHFCSDCSKTPSSQIRVAKRVKIIFILSAWDPVRKRNRNPGQRWKRERAKKKEIRRKRDRKWERPKKTRTDGDAHVHSREGEAPAAINRSGRFISQRAATVARRFRECSHQEEISCQNVRLQFLSILIS